MRLGTHLLLEVSDAPYATLNSSTSVLAALQAAVEAGGLDVVHQVVHEFPVQGCSAVLMISESHLSIHTWPEHGYAAIDMFTCGAESPLPCSSHKWMRYERQRQRQRYGQGWHCSSGERAGGATGSLWAAVQALLIGLDAAAATLTWFERGLPSPPGPRPHEPPPPNFRWLDQEQRPEL